MSATVLEDDDAVEQTTPVWTGLAVVDVAALADGAKATRSPSEATTTAAAIRRERCRGRIIAAYRRSPKADRTSETTSRAATPMMTRAP